jgi:hypothetical protein
MKTPEQPEGKKPRNGLMVKTGVRAGDVYLHNPRGG